MALLEPARSTGFGAPQSPSRIEACRWNALAPAQAKRSQTHEPRAHPGPKGHTQSCLRLPNSLLRFNRGDEQYFPHSASVPAGATQARWVHMRKECVSSAPRPYSARDGSPPRPHAKDSRAHLFGYAGAPFICLGERLLPAVLAVLARSSVILARRPRQVLTASSRHPSSTRGHAGATNARVRAGVAPAVLPHERVAAQSSGMDHRAARARGARSWGWVACGRLAHWAARTAKPLRSFSRALLCAERDWRSRLPVLPVLRLDSHASAPFTGATRFIPPA